MIYDQPRVDTNMLGIRLVAPADSPWAGRRIPSTPPNDIEQTALVCRLPAASNALGEAV